MSYRELAETLAPRFTKATVNLFEAEKEARGNSSWTVEAAAGTCRTDALREWALYSLAGYIQGCRASTKNDEKYLNFARYFITQCGRDFVGRGVFSTETEFDELAKDRISSYLTAISNMDAEKAMQSVGRTFLTNVGCNPDDISQRLGAVGSFVNQSTNTKKLFDEIQKTVRLVD